MKTIDIIREKLEALTDRVGNNAGIANKARKKHRESLDRHDKRLDRVEKRVYFLESVEASERIDLTERVGKWCEDPICKFSQHGTRWICNCVCALSHRRDNRSHRSDIVSYCRVCGTKRPNKIRVGEWIDANRWKCDCSPISTWGNVNMASSEKCRECNCQRPDPQQKPIKFGRWMRLVWECSCVGWGVGGEQHTYSEAKCSRCGDTRPGVWI